jgi:hypothetical protein
MNDLSLIAGLMPDTPLPGPQDLRPAQERLTAAISTERTGAAPVSSPSAGRPRRAVSWPGGHQLIPRWRLRRPGITACAVLALAGAIAAAMVIVPGHGRPTAARPAAASPDARPASAPPGTPRQRPATVNVAAATFLDHAAAALQQQPAQPPGPDQYVYTENLEGGSRVERAWLSANGNQPGLDMIWNGSRLLRDKPIPPCTIAQAGLSARTDGGEGGDCAIGGGYGPGYLAAMPTQASDLSAYLSEIGVAPTPAEAAGMERGWLANSLGKAIEEVLPYVYLLPAQQAALFQLMARTPGFTMIRGIRDGAGRVGVGIEWDFMGGPAQVTIFNPTTFAYMGTPGLGPGPEDDGSALVAMAFVSRAGQMP